MDQHVGHLVTEPFEAAFAADIAQYEHARQELVAFVVNREAALIDFKNRVVGLDTILSVRLTIGINFQC